MVTRRGEDTKPNSAAACSAVRPARCAVRRAATGRRAAAAAARTCLKLRPDAEVERSAVARTGRRRPTGRHTPRARSPRQCCAARRACGRRRPAAPGGSVDRRVQEGGRRGRIRERRSRRRARVRRRSAAGNTRPRAGPGTGAPGSPSGTTPAAGRTAAPQARALCCGRPPRGRAGAPVRPGHAMPSLDVVVHRALVRLPAPGGEKNRACAARFRCAGPRAYAACAASGSVAATGRSTSSTSAIGALSPWRKPNFRIRR